MASGSTGPRRESASGGRGGREPPTPRAEVNRLAQAAFRQRQKVGAPVVALGSFAAYGQQMQQTITLRFEAAARIAASPFACC